MAINRTVPVNIRAAALLELRRRNGAVTTGNPSYQPDQPPCDWITTTFYIPELNGPLQLAPYQQAVLNEAYRRDENGLYVYSVVVWSDIKKSIKSTIAAAVALERARRQPYGSTKIVANDLKQADSRVAFYARRAIELNPALRDTIKVKPSGYRIEFPNHHVIEAIPVDPKGEAGGNDDLIIFSELWAASQSAAQRMWTEMTLSPTKYGQSQRWVETYAGFSGESPLLEQLYTTGVKEGRQLDLGIEGLEVYANDSARMLCLWNTSPRLAWQTPEYYAQEAAVITPSEFQRVHRNQWVSSVDSFVPGEWWDACRSDIPTLGEYESMVGALDAAVSGDCFGIVVLSRIGEKTYKRYARAWTPSKGGKIEYGNPDNPDDVNYPEGEIRRLSREYNIVEWAYDPFQLHDMCTRLMREGVGWFRPFPQGQDRLKSDKQLYDDIRDRRIAHDGDPTLSEHVRNANAEVDKEDHKLRIIKRAEHLKIDLCVATSMANHEARRLILT